MYIIRKQKLVLDIIRKHSIKYQEHLLITEDAFKFWFSALNVPPHIRSIQVIMEVGNLPVLDAHGIVNQSVWQAAPVIDAICIACVFPVNVNPLLRAILAIVAPSFASTASSCHKILKHNYWVAINTIHISHNTYFESDKIQTSFSGKAKGCLKAYLAVLLYLKLICLTILSWKKIIF